MGNPISALVRQRRVSSKYKREPSLAVSLSLGSQTSEKTELNRSIGNFGGLNSKSAVLGGGIKRWFDILVAVPALVLLIPLCCTIALAIKMQDGGPVFYRHRRIGLNGTAFDCLKFRTMVVDSEEVLRRHLAANSEAVAEWEQARKLKRDPRVTPLGSSMRKTSVDELPQFVNILKGEMSLVGPRPIVAAEVVKYGASIGRYFCARPGLTGPWQVNGRNDIDYANRVALDCRYVEEWSFWRDLTIIAKTVVAVLSRRGGY
jgi:exopolysaccharide production protein ExoY